jgi:hypothetical protein
MKRTILTFLLGMFAFGFASAQKSYTMYETMYVTPKRGMEKQLMASMEAHNKKYHTTAPYEAFARMVVIGEREGQFVWGMGPTTFTALDGFDSQPNSETHDADWAMTVDHYIEAYSGIEYWKMNDELSYSPAEARVNKLQHIRFWSIKAGKYDAFKEVMKNVAAVFKANSYKDSWHFYTNEFETGNGRDVAAVSNKENWASFDRDGTFVVDYEKLYGKDSWKKAMATMAESTDGFTEEIRK